MKNASADQDFITETLPVFISEAQEQIESFEQLLLQLEDAPNDRELMDALFRCAHTVKGSAGVFGLDAVVAFTHHLETLLDRLREGLVALTPALSTLLLLGNDEIRKLVSAAAELGQTEDPATIEARAALVERLQAACGESGAETQPAVGHAAEPENAPSGAQRWQLGVQFGADTFRNGMDPGAILNYLRGVGEIVELDCHADAVPALEDIDPETCHLGFELGLETAASQAEIEAAFTFVRDDCSLQIERAATAPGLGHLLEADAITATAKQTPEQEQAVAEAHPHEAGLEKRKAHPATATANAKSGGGGSGGDENRYIRVQADRLDAVINLLGELVIAGAGAALMARQTRQRSLIEANLQMGRLIEEIRNGTLQLRMVPIGETFSRFRRVVRDTAAELGKDVVLDIQGGETEMDKSVVERIADPLMHLVRNALDHGLEAGAERRAAGKPEQGRLTMSARHESGVIAISITDDGRGIQREKVLQRAWDRGIVERGVVPPDEQVLNLIFEPGFSTAEKVTKLSGRGVGMDVVRRNIQALRGSIDLRSTEGQGSCIEIRLPLTLAIIDGFLVGVGSSRFIFPLDAVVEVIASRHTVTGVDARGRGVVELRGQSLPVVSLRALYALDSSPPARCSVVVLQSGGRRFGVVVDQLLGQHQTVIKPLGKLFSSLRGMSGSSILGNGEVALIFDVPALGQLAADASGQPLIPPTNSNAALTAEGHPA